MEYITILLGGKMTDNIRSMKKNWVWLLGVFFCFSFFVQGEITRKTLEERGVLMAPIGNNLILCVINTHHESGACWYILAENGNNQKLGSNLSQLMEVQLLSASPSKKYLAVLSVGEGHPMIEVVDLKLLKDKNKYKTLHIVDPYPGFVSFVGWYGERLILESDMPLNHRGKDGRVNSDLAQQKNARFILDITTGTIDPLKIRKGTTGIRK